MGTLESRADCHGEPAAAATCASCDTPLAGRSSFSLRSLGGWSSKCSRCGLVDGRLLRRSAAVAMIVGTALVGLNHGDRILAGTYAWQSSWYKIPLTYCVPFLVATYGALANGHVGGSSPGSAVNAQPPRA